MNIKTLSAPLLRLLFPPRCIFCDRLLPTEDPPMCAECHTEVSIFQNEPWKIPHVKHWISVWAYRGLVRQALIRYKFRGRRSYSRCFSRELAEKVKQLQQQFDIVTWVPISSLRKLSRGFDQVQVLACQLAPLLGVPAVRTLHKHRHNRRQSGIQGKQAREKNVRGVYRVLPNQQLQGKRILLIDDIVTTGSTVSEAAKMLKQAGAKAVYVACVACAAPM